MGVLGKNVAYTSKRGARGRGDVVKSTGGRQVGPKVAKPAVKADPNRDPNSTEGMSKNQIIRMKKKEDRLQQQKEERKSMKKVAPSRLPAEMKALRDQWIAAYSAKEFKGECVRE